jgi:adenosylcobinamide-GDP ribazoletransferase
MIKLLLNEIQSFYFALLFFTRLRLPLFEIKNFDNFKKCINYFPLVGLYLGLLNSLVYFISYKLFINTQISIIFYIIFYSWITRALHEDGLADFFDAFGGGKNKEHILKILKDSGIGVFGTIVLIFNYLLKILLLVNINNYLYFTIFITPFLSRIYILVIVKFYNYTEYNDDKSKTPFRKNDVRILWLLLYIIISITFLFIINKILILFFIFAFLILLFFMKYVTDKIDGYRGDVLGAAQQIFELYFIIAFYLIEVHRF